MMLFTINNNNRTHDLSEADFNFEIIESLGRNIAKVEILNPKNSYQIFKERSIVTINKFTFKINRFYIENKKFYIWGYLDYPLYDNVKNFFIKKDSNFSQVFSEVEVVSYGEDKARVNYHIPCKIQIKKLLNEVFWPLKMIWVWNKNRVEVTNTHTTTNKVSSIYEFLSYEGVEEKGEQLAFFDRGEEMKKMSNNYRMIASQGIKDFSLMQKLEGPYSGIIHKIVSVFYKGQISYQLLYVL